MSDKKLPDGLPPLPKGAVYLGMGLEFKLPIARFYGFGLNPIDGQGWDRLACLMNGTFKKVHYAAPIGSPIAILNGHSPEIKEEGRHRCQWIIQEDCQSFECLHSSTHIAHNYGIHLCQRHALELISKEGRDGVEWLDDPKGKDKCYGSPEVDINYFTNAQGSEVVSAKFARNLESQRDEWKRMAQGLAGAMCAHYPKSMVLNQMLAAYEALNQKEQL